MQHQQPDRQGRRPKNPAEAEFFDIADAAGWHIGTRVWPDFFLQRGDRIIAVEVDMPGRKLRPEKARLQAILGQFGIPVCQWTPGGGLVREGEGEGDEGEVVGGFEDTVRALQELSVSPKDVGSNGRGSGGTEDPFDSEPAAAAEAAPAIPSRSETAELIDRVESCFVTVMKPRKTPLGSDDRLIIRNALREASPEELEICIKTCEASNYHMKRGQHVRRNGGKYNSLGKILKPRPRLGETQRSRIEWWLDRNESSGVAGFPSADAAIVGQRQVEVQRGHQSGDPEMVQKATTAEAWLKEHGIETVRDARGYPTFRRIGISDTE